MLPTALEYPSGDWNGFRMHRPARGGRSCEHFGGYKTINRIPLPLHKIFEGKFVIGFLWSFHHAAEKEHSCMVSNYLTPAKNIIPDISNDRMNTAFIVFLSKCCVRPNQFFYIIAFWKCIKMCFLNCNRTRRLIVKNSWKRLQASKKDLNWYYRVSKHLGRFLLASFSSRIFQYVFEINEDKIDKNKCQWIYAMFVISKKKL